MYTVLTILYPVILLLGDYPREMKVAPTKTYTRIFTTILFAITLKLETNQMSTSR
jgi:hypothetical protein